MRISTDDFGVFVIFAALHTFVTLVLGTVDVMQTHILLAEVLKPISVIFGFPAILGLLFGQFVSNTSSSLGMIDLVTPVFSFIGLLLLLAMRERSVLVGSLSYTVPTSLWISYMWQVELGTAFVEGLVMIFPGQIAAMLIGYAIYWVVDTFDIVRSETVEKPTVGVQR